MLEIPSSPGVVSISLLAESVLKVRFRRGLLVLMKLMKLYEKIKMEGVHFILI